MKTDHIERFKLIALSHLAQVRDKDARAVAIIERLRARHKGGVLAPGEAAPSVPAELVSMQEERNNILKHARTELSTSMNAEDFKLFDDKVKNRISMPVEPPHSIR